ncbi:hAT transposon family protein [Methyloceanibacter caenitepidi]|uniref:HAT C-terminal dimerisation domain-containing protein n=1 Tax=Methyloceanibacter caenitepidi TaxID=1384459 RepID=A0A0A8K5X9_9HYPH|nr:hAT transposon family protein [Methyloceanibacter caenitepidi]BAQ17927.1 hypothetical protein GL4_2493 [Methyloceanibacter caenitepidi]
MITANARRIAGLLDALAQGDERRLRLEGGQLKGRVSKADRQAGVEHWLKTRGDRYPLLAKALREALAFKALRAASEPDPASIKTRSSFRDLQRHMNRLRFEGIPL